MSVRKGVTFSVTEAKDDADTDVTAKENFDPESTSPNESNSSKDKMSAREKRIKESKIVDADEEVKKMEAQCAQQ